MNDSQVKCDNELLNGHNFSSRKQGESQSILNTEISSEKKEIKGISNSNGCLSNDGKSVEFMRDAVRYPEVLLNNDGKNFLLN